MERRTTRREPVKIQAVLNTLHEESGHTRKGPPVGVTVEEISGRGARIRMPLFLRPGTLVQLETGEDLLLGEIIHCRGEKEAFVAGVEVDCVLHSGAGIRALMQALREEGIGTVPGDSRQPQPAPRDPLL
jgi:ACT domain-containing protein